MTDTRLNTPLMMVVPIIIRGTVCEAFLTYAAVRNLILRKPCLRMNSANLFAHMGSTIRPDKGGGRGKLTDKTCGSHSWPATEVLEGGENFPRRYLGSEYPQGDENLLVGQLYTIDL